MRLQDVVAALINVLGRHNVAAIVGVNKTSALSSWMSAQQPTCDLELEARLRLALRLVRIIEARFSKETASAWMQGANPSLDDETPIALVACGALSEVQKPLLLAAWAFVEF